MHIAPHHHQAQPRQTYAPSLRVYAIEAGTSKEEDIKGGDIGTLTCGVECAWAVSKRGVQGMDSPKNTPKNSVSA